MTKLADLTKQFGGDPNLNPTLAEADGILEASRLTMTVIAGVNAVENYGKTAEGAKMATQILLEKSIQKS